MAKPIFCATHPRACSTAFERVFMTRKDLTCVHEPFGDAFYYGPERMGIRYENDEEARNASGFSGSTYKTIFDRLDREQAEGKRIFIKDILHYLVPPNQQPPKLAPSLKSLKRGIGTGSTSHEDDRVNGINGVNGTHHVNGVNGVNGAHHTNGINGVNGAHHTNGINGVNGAHHTNGVNGVNGAHHSNGVNGVNGSHHTNRVNGVNGVNGAHHTNGVNGVNGVNGAHHANGANGITKKAPFPYPTEAEPGNPTIAPKALLEKFHFTFLIRDPHSSIPSYYRCTIPPLDHVTGFYEFYPCEAGYDELRRFFDYTRESGLVGDNQTSGDVINGAAPVPEVCVVDADDLLDDPEGIIRAYCKSVGLEFRPGMLKWDNEEDQERAKIAFEKWKGFHEDAIDSTDLKPRAHKKAAKSEEQWDAEWRAKYGEKAAKLIRQTVDQNMADYLHLKQFAIKA